MAIADRALTPFQRIELARLRAIQEKDTFELSELTDDVVIDLAYKVLGQAMTDYVELGWEGDTEEEISNHEDAKAFIFTNAFDDRNDDGNSTVNLSFWTSIVNVQPDFFQRVATSKRKLFKKVMQKETKRQLDMLSMFYSSCEEGEHAETSQKLRTCSRGD